MQVSQQHWTPGTAIEARPGVSLVLAFGSPALMADSNVYAHVARCYPGAVVVGCSSSGEIEGDQVHDDTLVLTEITFARTDVHLAWTERRVDESDEAMGERLGARLPPEYNGLPLAHVCVLADGVHLNGTAFAAGVGACLPSGPAITGGLAGDVARFVETPVWAEGVRAAPAGVALGFYGQHLRVGWGAVGGWHPFGPDRLVTRSEGNVLYELDGTPALGVYKKYLGPHAKDLPGSGLLFPLSIRRSDGEREIVRSTLGIDEAEGSIRFAGDIPQGTYARFMKTNTDRLADGATEAAEDALAGLGGAAPTLAFLVSCVGRRIVMGAHTENELEAVAAALGGHAVMAGFYSHGEIAPFGGAMNCDLHNQTMTITLFAEDV